MAKKKINYDLYQIIEFMKLYNGAKTAEDQMKNYERTREAPNMSTQMLTPNQIRQGIKDVSRYHSEMPEEIKECLSLNAPQLLEKLLREERMLQFRMPIHIEPPHSLRLR